MPEVPTILLLLGNRSPYGLSVARAVLDAGLPVRAVVLPSPVAWERARRRASQTAAAPWSRLRGAGRRLKRALDRRSPREIPGGEPVAAPELDPGVTEAQLQARCQASGIGWHVVDEVRSAPFLALVRESGAGVVLSAAFPLILSRKLLALPERGAINLHPSLLPRCRGSHPIYWTLASGEREGGVSAHVMTEDLDAGDLVAQIALPLSDGDDYGSLYRRAMAASPELVARVAAFLREGSAGRPQDGGRATSFREDGERDHEIRWSEQPARAVVALTRTGEAFTWLRGQRLGVLAARPAGERPAGTRPGRVLGVTAETFCVGAAAGVVELRYVVWGGRGYAAGPLADALGLRPGEVLG